LEKLGYHGLGDERIDGPVPEPPRFRDVHGDADPACDPERPRIFHLLWAGDFTDKPYAAALAFLYSQNLGLHLPLATDPDPDGLRAAFLRQHCRPQLWIHINPGPAASVQTPAMRERLMDDLRSNPWSAPLLHDRFSEVISFRFYNVSDHLDAIPELRPHWRHMPLFKSGQVTFGQKPYEAQEQQIVLHNEAKLAKARQEEERELRRQREDGEGGQAAGPGAGQRRRVQEHAAAFDDSTPPAEAVDNALNTDEVIDPVPDADRKIADVIDANARHAPAAATGRARSDTSMFERVGSTSYGEYDRLTTTLSDMARFVLCHRYGGVYIDADTLLLRDWEELWNWRGAFAYRWSRLPEYNTAIMRMHRYSALGSFIFKVALANGLDFHPVRSLARRHQLRSTIARLQMSVWQYLNRAKLHGLLLRLPDALFDPAWLNTEYYQRDRPPFPYFAHFEGACFLSTNSPSEGR
jgi:WD repeat and SOF domain-containing protein 1